IATILRVPLRVMIATLRVTVKPNGRAAADSRLSNGSFGVKAAAGVGYTDERTATAQFRRPSCVLAGGGYEIGGGGAENWVETPRFPLADHAEVVRRKDDSRPVER